MVVAGGTPTWLRNVDARAEVARERLRLKREKQLRETWELEDGRRRLKDILAGSMGSVRTALAHSIPCTSHRVEWLFTAARLLCCADRCAVPAVGFRWLGTTGQEGVS